ncbi:MAG: 4Fe-4S binding protein [Clostridia bacterium]|nr:4Fe-4S binding protein [Clostridia bacterium]
MGKVKNWILSHLPTKRRLIQLYAVLLFNANLKGFGKGRIYQGPIKNICAPGLNCYSCPGASAACPLGALQNALTASNAKAATYMFGIILLYGMLFGRWICGFLCPFGLIQDLLHKIKTPKLKKNRVTRVLSYLKYVVLGLFVIVLPLMFAGNDVILPAFCKYICPSGTLLGGIGLLGHPDNAEQLGMLGPLFTWKFVLLVIFVVASIFIYRFFCRFFCPLGALYGLFNKIALFGIKLEKPKCIDCGRCLAKCEMDIRHVGDHECINCGACIPVCPAKAISWKGSQVFIAPNEIAVVKAAAEKDAAEETQKAAERVEKTVEKRKFVTKIVAVVLMLSLLAGALVYYNVLDKGAAAAPPVETPVGDTFNPAKNQGKVTVINFWGTWCQPCKDELPHFDELATEFDGRATFLILNTEFEKEKAPDYIATHFPESKMLFGYDAGDAYFQTLGGLPGAYPMTVVLDVNGVIIARHPGAVSYEELKADIEKGLSAGPTTGLVLPGKNVGNLCYGQEFALHNAKSED